jgi:hypothetical protein
MGNNGSVQMFQQGLDLFNDVKNSLGGQRKESRNEAGVKGRAALLETDASGEAHDIRRQAEQDAERLRDERERSRSMGRARWGGSNLAMSGSKALIRDANRLKDRQDEEDVLFEGELKADSRRRAARNQANMLRIDNGVSPVRSTLSLGSRIYGRD